MKESKKIRCPECYAVLCHVIPTSDGNLIHFKKSSYNVYTPWCVMNCGKCGAVYRLKADSKKVIEEKIANRYYEEEPAS